MSQKTCNKIQMEENTNATNYKFNELQMEQNINKTRCKISKYKHAKILEDTIQMSKIQMKQNTN